MAARLIAMALALTVPSSASAGPLKDAIERAAREAAFAQAQDSPAQTNSSRWPAIALLVAGGTLITLGAAEVFDDEDGADDVEDTDESDDGEDSDWGNTALTIGGIAAAGAGGWMLISGRNSPSRNPSIAIGRSVRF
jgi:hypothetical protein